MASFRAETRGHLLRILLPAVLLGSCAVGMRGGPLLLHPIPPAEGPYRLSRGGLVFEGPGFRAVARPVDWRMAEEEFGEDWGDLSECIFISLRLENSSPQRIDFNTSRASISTRSSASSGALDVTDVCMLSRNDATRKEKARRFRLLAWDGSVTVGPGESDERYLVFPVPQGQLTPLELTLTDLHLGGRSFDLAFLFEVFPVNGR